MSTFSFGVIVPGSFTDHDAILDATDALAEAGCLDASICGHAEGMELFFERDSESLEAAIRSAIADVEGAGFAVARVEVEREALCA
jgi:hypothetical protein